MAKSKLLSALDAYKGRDHEKERQKKLAKAAEKRKAAKKQRNENEEADVTENAVNGTTQNDDKSTHEASEHESDSEGSEGNSGDEEVNGEVPTDKKGNEQESESEGEEEDGDRSDEENEDEEEEDIPLSDLSGDERADVIPHQRLTINNSAAITASIKRISFITPNTPFSEHNSLVSKEPIDVPDPHDDLNRELAFYKVCQAAAVEGRRLLRKEGIPFSRPGDYFAEMVKSDEHMNKIKKKMYEEAAAKKAAAEAKRQRQLKKFGKQVQVAKLQQRQKEKRETLEKINSLKRKRKADQAGITDDDDEMFDVAIEEASKSEKKKKGPNLKRQKKNEKYGYGGKKRFKKSTDAASSADLSGFSVKKMKAGTKKKGGAAKRPGKSRRKAMKK